MNPSTAIKSNTDFPDRGIPIFLLTDEQGLIYGASESLQLFTGKSRQELIGHSIAVFLSEAEANKFKAFIGSAGGDELDSCSIFLKGRRQDDKISFYVKRRKTGSNLFDWTCIAGSDFGEMLKGYDEMPWFIQFFERSAEPVFIYNAVDLTLTFVNEAALHLYGHAGKDLLNCFLYDEETIHLAASPEHPYILQPGNYSLFSKSGKQVSVQVFTSPIDIHGSTHCLVFGTQVQIVEKENVLLKATGKQPALAHTPGELDMIVASMDDVVFEYDSEGLFRKVWCRNETVLLMIPEQFLGKSMQEAFRALPDFVAPFIHDFETALSRKEICYRDFSIRSGNSNRWFNSKITPLFHSNGSAKGFTQRITDITEQKMVELAIEEKNSELKATHKELGEIIEHSSDIIFKFDLEGRILFVSPEITRSLGYKAEQVKGKYFGKLVYADDLALCENILKSLRQFGNEEKALVCRLVMADGTLQWFSISAVYTFDEKKQPLYCIGFAKNVNELQQLVESLKATEERYSAFINHSTEGIWRFEYGEPLPVTQAADEIIAVFMKQAYLAECNDQMAKFYGNEKAADIIGTPLRKLLPPDNPRNIEFLRSFINNGFQLLNAESFEIDKYGSKKYFLNNLIGIVRDGLLLRVWGTQRDITDQRKAEDQIRFLARVVKDVSDAIISTDLDFRVFAWNKAAEFVYGISEEEAIGKPIRQLVDHHYINCTREEVIEHLDSTDTWEGETYFDRKDGKRVYVSITLSYVKNEKGIRIGFAGIHRDITARKESEDALRISEQRYRSLVEALGEGIFLIDRKGDIIASNKSAEKITGRTKEQLLKVNMFSYDWMMVHEDGTPYEKEEKPSYITLKKGIPLQNVIMGVMRSDQERCWLSINTEPIYYTSGSTTPDAIVVSLVDITEKKISELELLRSEQQLREYSQRISNLLDSITDGFLAVDNDLKVVLWNRVLEKTTGTKASEVIGKSITDLYPEILEKKIYQKYFHSLKENNPVTFEAYSERLNIWFESSAYPSGQGLFIYFRDITERKMQEHLLSLEKDVLEINSQPAASLKNTVDYFLEGLERIFPGMLCSVLTVDAEEKKIRHLSAPSLPSNFAAEIDGLSIGPCAGSCGTAMFLRQRVISVNIEIDPLWVNMREMFLKFDIRSSWAFPIMNIHGEVVATISAYHKYPKTPDEKALRILERISNLLRIIIVNKKAEEMIRLSNERFQLISRAANDAIWDWDIAVNRIYWGEGFHSLFNYEPGYRENSIQFWEEQIHEEDRETVLKSLHDFLKNKTGRVWSHEYRFRKSDGNFVLVLDRGFLIYNQDGSISRMVGSMQDITEKREMEKQLLKQQFSRQQIIAQAVVDAQEKERADIGKELHDNVNQILSTARLFLDLARSDENDRINLIKRSTSNISDAINEIRNISRSLVPGSIGDLGIIESIKDLVETVKATRKLSVEFYHEGDADKILDDKQKLMLFRIIQEQVNNVLKHAEARNLVIELVVYEEGIDLTISDNGIGFEPEKIKNKKGVGLYNISSRAELFNGKVNIVTSPGNGCKMNIHVPIINL